MKLVLFLIILAALSAFADGPMDPEYKILEVKILSCEPVTMKNTSVFLTDLSKKKAAYLSKHLAKLPLLVLKFQPLRERTLVGHSDGRKTESFPWKKISTVSLPQYGLFRAKFVEQMKGGDRFEEGNISCNDFPIGKISHMEKEFHYGCDTIPHRDICVLKSFPKIEVFERLDPDTKKMYVNP